MSFEHIHLPASDPAEKRALLLLHGTGGSQHDLVDIGQALLPEAEIVSPLGKVRESIYSRWFKRFEEGIFDEEDMRRQADDLASFLKGFDKQFIAIGYSNGANMGAALMTLHPEVLSGLVMWRGMQIFQEPVRAELTGKKVLMNNGVVDAMGPIESARRQAEIFRQSGAEVETHEFGTGHGLTQADFEATKAWLNS